MQKTRLWIASAIISICSILSACAEMPVSEAVDISSQNSSIIVAQEIEQDENIPENPQMPEPEEPASSENDKSDILENQQQTGTPILQSTFSIDYIDPYSGQPYTIVNENIPYFSESDLSTDSFESYSDLDELGRCGAACANIGIETMPTEERGEIGQIKPSGWHLVKYDNVNGKYLYNRCHLIGYQLSGENANEKNLITGTRYMNVDGMLPFENMVVDYVKETENHVLYRVTPVFEGDNLLASGVLMEARSIEDNGEGISFCVYVYNVQPDIIIDYSTGESSLDPRVQSPVSTPVQTPAAMPTSTPVQAPAAMPTSTPAQTPTIEPTPEPQEQKTEESAEQLPVIQEESQGMTYILNTNTYKFHYPYCSSVDQMSDRNKQEYTGNRDDIISMGYDPCKRCNP